MIRYCFIVIAFFLAEGAIAQEYKYPVSAIPEILKKNTHLVKRIERSEFELKSPGKAVFTVTRAITLLDESAKNDLLFYVSTDKFHSLGDVSIRVYDAQGILLNKYTRKDLSNESGNWGDLVRDGKIYYLMINALHYPLTIESEYEQIYNGIFSYPAFNIQKPKQSVEKTEYVLKLPRDMEFRYKEKNVDIKPRIDDSDKKYLSYSWSDSALPARAYDEESGLVKNSFPMIVMAPTKFELDGYEGDMTSWKNLGLWYNSLVKDDNKLSPEYRNEILALVKDVKDDHEKIKILYNYLQKNFRYVSIQLGIGGLKPFSANFVHKNKYGDCKALSNYMEACFNAVNIKSYSAWIEAGADARSKDDPAFPYDHFDHQILCIPMPGDTMWLECTSSTKDPGFMGKFTDDRDALLLTENGGVLVQTPKNTAAANTFTCNSVVSLNEDGSGSAKILVNTSGEYREDFLLYLGDRVKDDQKNYLVNGLGFEQPDKLEITYDKNNKQKATSITMEIEKIPDFTAGNKYFLNPRIYKLWRYELPKAENRTQDFYFDFPLIKTDTTTYKLPEGYGLETLPKAKELKFEYGSFSSTYRFDEQQRTIVTTARLVLNDYKIPAAKFPATKKFFNDVLSEYTEKIVIKH